MRALSFKAFARTWLAMASMLLIVTGGSVHADGTASSDPWRTRCGWFDNPSPGNATLTDRQSEWAVAQQGMSSAEGAWPTFKRAQWVRTGSGSAGYGCACLKVREDAENHTITHIIEARAKALSVCRRDKALTEPVNPLQ